MENEFIEKESDNYRNLQWLNKYIGSHNGFIAGGCFKNIFNNEKIKDLDIFFENEDDLQEAIDYYNKNGCTYEFYYRNDNVVAFIDKNTGIRLELIQKTFGTPEEIINDFDFSITKFAYFTEEFKREGGSYGTTYKIIHHKDFFEHLHMKRLVVNKDLLYPFGTFERMIRYIKYGYMPCKESKLNIIKAIKDKEITKDDDLSESLYEGID